MLHPIIPPLPHKTTGHRPYHSVCGHRPVSLPPLTTAINIFTPLNGPILTIGGFYRTPSWVSSCSSKTPFLPPENCPQFLLSEPLAAAIQGWFQLSQKTPIGRYVVAWMNGWMDGWMDIELAREALGARCTPPLITGGIMLYSSYSDPRNIPGTYPTTAPPPTRTPSLKPSMAVDWHRL